MFIAKWDNANSHDLLAHMMDVGAVATQLLEDVVNRSLVRTIHEEFAQPTESQSLRLAAFFAATHDFGKASPAFQVRTPARESLIAKGLSITIKRSGVFHADLTYCLLPTTITRMWPGWESSRKWVTQMARTLAGHHGFFSDRPITTLRDRGNEVWEKARQNLLTELSESMGISSEPNPPDAGGLSSEAVMFFAGLVTIADWIGSNAAFFNYTSEVDGPEDYFRSAQEKAAFALKKLGWKRMQVSVNAETSYEDILPEGADPNPLQVQVEQLVEENTGPGLWILESMTGSGKTEASWRIAKQHWQKDAGAAMYIAMPTMATGNQMHTRVSRFLQRVSMDKTTTPQLIHGQAALRRAERKLELKKINQDGDKDAWVDAASWFHARKRGLLYPFAVGTVDQAFLSVMQTRHAFVRLSGLANKVVIFDEVHAYDTYMNVIFNRLLEWLASLNVTVILLSATLPKERKRGLLAAYTGLPEDEIQLTDGHYPRVTLGRKGHSPVQHGPDQPGNDRAVAIQWIQGDDPKTVLDEIEARTEQGGCVAWVSNTVTLAQERYKALQKRVDEGDFPRTEIILFHAKFASKDRKAREEAIMERFGPEAAVKKIRPRRSIVIATQVIEQSLDLDFDLMVSDIAPVDLLLQRVGRVHRHANHRPPGLESPLLLVSEPRQSESGEPEFGPSQWIYPKVLLLRTWLQFQKQDFLHIPSDVDDLLNSVYGPPVALDIGSEMKRWLDTWMAEFQNESECAQAKARSTLLPQPSANIFHRANRGLRDDDDPTVAMRAMTRDADPSVDIIFLHESSQGLYIDDSLTNPVDLEAELDEKTAVKLAGCAISVSLSGPRSNLPELLDGTEHRPPAWRRNPFLRHMRLIRLRGREATFGRTHFRLSDELGLEVHHVDNMEDSQ